MAPFETSATVGDNGQIQVDGVPFAPGTAVEVIIQPVQPSGQEQADSAESRTSQLFAALDKSRNTQSVATFRRGDLCDRNVLH